MADVTLTYKGSDILELSDSGSATLKTGGCYCEDDIEVEYVKPSGGGERQFTLLSPAVYIRDPNDSSNWIDKTGDSFWTNPEIDAWLADGTPTDFRSFTSIYNTSVQMIQNMLTNSFMSGAGATHILCNGPKVYQYEGQKIGFSSAASLNTANDFVPHDLISSEVSRPSVINGNYNFLYNGHFFVQKKFTITNNTSEDIVIRSVYFTATMQTGRQGSNLVGLTTYLPNGIERIE